MAILGMKKMALVAHRDSKDALLKSIQTLGAIEIVSSSLEGLAAASSPLRLAQLEAQLCDVRAALDTIRLYDDEKPSFFAPKPQVSLQTLQDALLSESETHQIIDKIKQFQSDMAALKTRRQRLVNRMAQMEPFASFDIPLESLGESTYTTSLMGTLPDESAQGFVQIGADYADNAYFERAGFGKGLFSVYVVMHNSIRERLTGELKYIGLSEVPGKESVGTPADIIHDCDSELEALSHEMHEHEEKAKKYSQHKQLLFLVEDYLLTEIARERCIEKLGETGSAFAMEGWAIAEDTARIEKAVLDAAPEAFISFREPADDETPPTALSNPKVVSPFEAVTSMYSVPYSRGFDPNLLVAVFYFIIFGMMMADVVYGLILTIGALLLLRFKKPTGMFRKITTVVMICGISTSLWGVFFGNILSIEGIPYVINPLSNANDALLMLVLCLGIGVLHIFTGLITGMVIDIRRGRVFDAICDRFSWVLLISGGIMLMLGGIIGTVGTYMALAGAAILLFTQGRHKKGVLKKIVGGLSSLYGVTGYLGDILSYCRIFGMGLATTVIAMVFNTIAGLLMDSAILYVFGLVVLTVGHVFNIAINTLGAFVHTARLQYIEFFNKFYEGDGRTFNPLTLRTRHHRIVE